MHKTQHTIVLFHAMGQTSFELEDVQAYRSLENLIESDVLAGVPNREKSLTQLWEAAQMLTNPQDEEAENSESKE